MTSVGMRTQIWSHKKSKYLEKVMPINYTEAPAFFWKSTTGDRQKGVFFQVGLQKTSNAPPENEQLERYPAVF